MNLMKWLDDKCNEMSGIRKEEIKKSPEAAPTVKLINVQDGKFHAPNDYRVRRGEIGSDDSYGNDGAFLIPSCHRDEVMTVISSDGMGWEHVSVSLGPTSNKCPTWQEMCQVKGLFWDEDVCVIQFHPAKKDYVNHHKGCLHMWRQIGVAITVPPKFMVG